MDDEDLLMSENHLALLNFFQEIFITEAFCDSLLEHYKQDNEEKNR